MPFKSRSLAEIVQDIDEINSQIRAASQAGNDSLVDDLNDQLAELRRDYEAVNADVDSGISGIVKQKNERPNRGSNALAISKGFSNALGFGKKKR